MPLLSGVLDTSFESGKNDSLGGGVEGMMQQACCLPSPFGHAVCHASYDSPKRPPVSSRAVGCETAEVTKA